MREADRLEVLASSGSSPLDACRLSVAWTPRPRVVLLNGELAGLYGIAPVSVIGGQGSPWFLGTDAIVRHWRVFMRHSRPVFLKEANRFSYLENRVHKDNLRSIRWLRWLGFTIHNAERHGPRGELFHKFTMRLGDV